MLDITTTKQAILKTALNARKSKTDKVADYEVLIIGAGIAGIGMACHYSNSSIKAYSVIKP
ncbi:hypothetical protein [Psychrobacter proteolyticus]|uniref:hypothetical protein n=1 Tax=Psychrobacter proteolyticus TaxID=147825 RepID=UPI001D0F84C8|nr:hypothetical protein [Psychrobacter proteolyticus]